MHKVFLVASLIVSVIPFVGWDNLDYGVPTTNGVIVLDREGYACGFDLQAKQPRWVSYRLTAAEASAKRRLARTNDFREDPRLPYGSVTLSDYRGSGYDRGHIAPAADMGWKSNVLSESFLLSNMSPQRPEFNRGVWKELESWTRARAIKHAQAFIYSGPIYGSSTNFIGRNRVLVPEGYYKILLAEGTNSPLMAIGFMLPNEGSKNSIESFACKVSDIEKATGLDFFSALPLPMQSNLQERVDFSAW